MEQARALDLLARLAFALAAIHAAGVVHRDLKPDNIVLRDGASPVVVDFGIAVIDKVPDLARGAGTLSYMAPEQVRGRRTDLRADLYSLGVIAHELLGAGRPEPPVGRFSLLNDYLRARKIRMRMVAGGTDRLVADLVARLLASPRRRRPNSAALVGARFAEAASRAALLGP